MHIQLTMRLFLISFITLFTKVAIAQFPGMGKGGGQSMNIGRIYGKIIDAATSKPIDAVSVQLYQNKFDSVSKTKKDVIVNGQLTKGNGEFNLEGLQVFGNYKLKISAIGYKTIEQKIAFDVKMNGGDMSQMLNKINKDLGNIKLESEIKEIKEVVVTGEKPQLQLGIDRKIFNVDKNIVSAGGNAVDVMRNVPTVSVDVDGNVTLRNNSPEIFVDGRPTVMTLEQIPADAIQSIELITNPSAKFDASGGQSAIINIVLKKNRQRGYSGNIRTGIDMRARTQSGGDINMRQGKINVFANAMVNQRKTIAWGETDRNNLLPADNLSSLFLENDNTTDGGFAFIRGGLDYFINNRNTISFNGNISGGNFNTTDVSDIEINLLKTPFLDSTEKRSTAGENIFRNYGGQISYKRVYTKPGKEWQADINYNQSKSDNDQSIDIVSSKLYETDPAVSKSFKQGVDAGGKNKLLVVQTDYTNPLNENTKIEMGLRTQIRWFESFQFNSINGFVLNGISNRFSYIDNVHAAYINYAQKISSLNMNLQAGLRAESSSYEGNIVGKSTTFSNQFPLALFPSAFISKSFKGKQDIQLNYTRRVKRPTFFQLIPNTDYTDILNFQTGNPNLIPEFTNSIELSYQKTYGKKNHTVLATIFGKQTENLIARYQESRKLGNSDTSAFVTTWVNATTAFAAGLELVFKNTITKWWETNYNFNFYYSRIEGTKELPSLQNERTSYTFKINNTFKLGKGWTMQLNGDYNSRAILPVSSGGGGGGGRGGMMGGGMWGGGQVSTTQGYIDENYYADLGLRKEFKIKNNTATISANWSDFLRTRQNIVYSEGTGFNQNSWRRRDPQFFRINFNYRFGKLDVTLFKRKNNRMEMDDMQMP